MNATASIRKATFKHVEAELYSLGEYFEELKSLDKRITDSKEDPSVLNGVPMYIYAIRIRYLETLFDVMLSINTKVDYKVNSFIELRYFQNKSLFDCSMLINLPQKQLRKIHKLIVETMIEKLGMDGRFETDKHFVEDNRYIPAEVRMQVKIRDNNSCVKCGSKRKLHFHHIEHYAKGGLHEVDNLMILCSKCHADEHEGEKAYHLLKEE